MRLVLHLYIACWCQFHQYYRIGSLLLSPCLLDPWLPKQHWTLKTNCCFARWVAKQTLSLLSDSWVHVQRDLTESLVTQSIESRQYAWLIHYRFLDQNWAHQSLPHTIIAFVLSCVLGSISCQLFSFVTSVWPILFLSPLQPASGLSEDMWRLDLLPNSSIFATGRCA